MQLLFGLSKISLASCILCCLYLINCPMASTFRLLRRYKNIRPLIPSPLRPQISRFSTTYAGSYDHDHIEKKWQKYWDEHETFKAIRRKGFPKKYILDMFPYPSGSGLHVGHPEGYTATDIAARFWRMNGHDVLHPMGWVGTVVNECYLSRSYSTLILIILFHFMKSRMRLVCQQSSMLLQPGNTPKSQPTIISRLLRDN